MLHFEKLFFSTHETFFIPVEHGFLGSIFDSLLKFIRKIDKIDVLVMPSTIELTMWVCFSGVLDRNIVLFESEDRIITCSCFKNLARHMAIEM